MTPGELEQANAELAAAAEELRGSRLLLDEGLTRPAASRTYYAAFHAMRAVLTARGEHAKTHAGQVTLFERAFGSNPLLGRVLEIRSKADYGTEFDRPRDQLAADLEDVSEFVERCGTIVRELTKAGPDEPDPPPDH